MSDIRSVVLMMWLCRYVVLSLLVLGQVQSQVNYGGEYVFEQSVYLAGSGLTGDGYRIEGVALIQPVHRDLLSVQLKDFKFHDSEQDVFGPSPSLPFFVEINGDGLVKNIYTPSSEDIRSLALKKSLSSLLQFSARGDKRRWETDVSGECSAEYQIRGAAIVKKKSQCNSFKNMGTSVWDGLLVGEEGEVPPSTLGTTIIHLSKEHHLSKVSYEENIHIRSSLSHLIETAASTKLSLTLVKKVETGEFIQAEERNIEDIVSGFSDKLHVDYSAQSLSHQRLQTSEGSEPTPELASLVKKNFKALSPKALGSARSASAALDLLQRVKRSSFDQLYKVLTSKSNKKIVAELLDILGAVQTAASHKAAMEFLQMNSMDANRDLCERYLWALSTSYRQELFIIQDLMTLSKGEISDDKILETLMQTIASLTRKYFEKSQDSKFFYQVSDYILERLAKCEKTDELCHRIYLKAIKNLRSPKAVNLLLELTFSRSRRIGVLALRALHALGREHWTLDLLRAAEQVYFASGRFDSSAKVLALEILLGLEKPAYRKLVQILKKRQTSTELKEYLLQRLNQISDKCPETREAIRSALREEGLWEWNSLAGGGLSTAFDRPLGELGALSTAQQVSSGLLKQGFVDIQLYHPAAPLLPQTVFSLGLFSNGLDSVLGGGDEDRRSSGEESTEEEGTEEAGEEMNAGLELSVLGTEFRPFVLFEGQGELMGHVFSGTGSSLTPAYQAIVLLHDDPLEIPLGSGDSLTIDVLAVGSVDLSGKIEISLWSRTADLLVQNRAGLVVQHVAKLDSPYMKFLGVSNLTAEPQLLLTADVSFSGKMALCLKLEQPQSTLSYKSSSLSWKTGSGEGSAGVSQRRNRQLVLPGKTFALNSKNDRTCREMYLASL